MPVRNLEVLDLNDREHEYRSRVQSGEGVFKHFDVRSFGTWQSVQADLASGAPRRPDIVLADIDFELDPSLRHASFPGCGTAKPIGPLLALPYLGKRSVSAFAIYSAHFEKGEKAVIFKSPTVILPMGLLAATLEGKTYQSRHLGGEMPPGAMSLEEYLDDLPRVGNPVDALESILEIYTNRLVIAVDKGIVRITNGEQLRRMLHELQAELANGPRGRRVPVPDSMSLDTYSRGFGADRIKWLSLCADIVDFVRDDVGDEELAAMQILLEAFVGADPAFQKTLEVIRVLEKREEAAAERPKYLDIAMELYSQEPATVRHEILRLGVLFANVSAWAKNDYASMVKKDVFRCLGISDVNTIKSWLGERSRRPGAPVADSFNIDPLPMFESKTGVPERFLDWHERKLSAVDEERVAHYQSVIASGGGFCI